MFITVLTPTYNRARTLHRVFESIQKQTLKKQDGKYIFEWIIVDDGSEDNTKELVEMWQKKVDWPILYLFQENRGKAHALANGITFAKGELCLIADSDDAFLADTFEVFYNIWHRFDTKEKELCGGIGVLCQDQYGKRVGCDYPIAQRLLPAYETVLGWKDIGLGETWAALKTSNLKKAFVVPKSAEKLQFIPESFFWDRIVFELKPYAYYVNKIQRIYYRNEADSISKNIRKRYPEGFLFESQWFVTKYYSIVLKYPRLYVKHLLKLIYYYFCIKVRNMKERNGTK